MDFSAAEMDTGIINLTDDCGITKQIIKEGSGESPKKGVEVFVHYVGTLLDGTVFDSSRERDEKFKFTLGQGSVIKGWDIGVASMKRGEKAMLTCTAPYAYGEKGSPPKIPADATLKFEVELFDWKHPTVTIDGFITKDEVKEGEGYQKPNDGASCIVRYTGRIQGSGFIFSPEQERTVVVGDDESVPSGFNTCLKHMNKGERTIFYIKPSEHHFEDFSMPEGVTAEDSLEYDIEMIDFTREKESWSMSNTEKIEHASASKAKGNDLFKRKRFSDASKKYESVVSYLEKLSDASESETKEANDILIAALNNLSNIHLKNNDHQSAITNCTKVLDIEQNNTKALYRRSLAYFDTGDNKKSQDDIKAALKDDKSNKLFVAHFHKVKGKISLEKDKERAMYQKMFK